MNTRNKMLVAALLTAGLTMGGAVPANAATYTYISGQVYSSSTAWFYSTNIRTKSGTGSVLAYFTDLPNGCSPVGSTTSAMKFAIVESASSTVIGSIRTYSSLGQSYEQTLASNVANGKLFRTTFARVTTCSEFGSFTGQMYY